MRDMGRIDAEYTWRGFRAVVMENRHLRALFLPELGGKLWSLIDKRHDREVLWHNPRMQPRSAPYGATYDDWFSGGWDELFPNDAPTSYSGESYPDHGEWWSMPFEWHVSRDATSCSLHLQRNGVVTNTSVMRTITLDADSCVLQIAYTLTNHSYKPLDYLWKLHPAMQISASSRIDMPATQVLLDAGFRERFGADVATAQWPFAHTPDGIVDMRLVPDASVRSCDFYYGIDLSAGWCALTDTQHRYGAGLVFDPHIFRSVWVFGAYGGWRDLYVAILEPCTGYPYRLEEAVHAGTASRIAAGDTLQTAVHLVLYDDVSGIAHIGWDGQVTPA
jgi:hypothetical protein